MEIGSFLKDSGGRVGFRFGGIEKAIPKVEDQDIKSRKMVKKE